MCESLAHLKKYRERPSPAFPAQECAGTIKQGNNGALYESVADKNGRYSWKLLPKDNSKDNNSKKSKSKSNTKLKSNTKSNTKANTPKFKSKTTSPSKKPSKKPLKAKTTKKHQLELVFQFTPDEHNVSKAGPNTRSARFQTWLASVKRSEDPFGITYTETLFESDAENNARLVECKVVGGALVAVYDIKTQLSPKGITKLTNDTRSAAADTYQEGESGLYHASDKEDADAWWVDLVYIRAL